MSQPDCNSLKTCETLETKLNIEQRIDGIDQLTCMTNTLLQSLAASCDINIDYSSILKCNEAAINSQSLPDAFSTWIDIYINCEKQKNPQFDGDALKEKITKAFKSYAFFLNNSELKIPVKCSEATQSNDGPPCDPSIKCYVTATYQIINKQPKTIGQISSTLCNDGPIMCAIDGARLPDDFGEFISGAIYGIGPPGEVPTYTVSRLKEPLSVIEKLNCDNIGKTNHAILLVGLECIKIGDTVYIEYTFKDTYQNSYGQVSWKLRVPVMDGFFTQKSAPPFGIGITNPLTGASAVSAKITNCSKVKEEYEKCCGDCYWQCDGGSQMWVKTAGCDNCVDANQTLECNEDNNGATTLTLCLDD